MARLPSRQHCRKLPDRHLDDQISLKRADVSKAKRGVTDLLKRRRLDWDANG
jgi:hypothetical protein